MKKRLLYSLLLSMSTAGAFSQTLTDGNKFFDNWSIGIKGGTLTPFKHNAFFKNMRPAVGLELSKQITPGFGMGIEGMGYINTSPSKTVFDLSNVTLLGKFNFINIFGGYHGTPRMFEAEALIGAGWLHSYINDEKDDNYFSTKVGMNFNFNLGTEQIWTIALRPALIYNMEGDFDYHKSRFNANNAAVEITAGIIYHFKNSNGKHHFSTAKAYNQAEIDALNHSINKLRNEIKSNEEKLSSANQTISELNRMLENCRNKKTEIKTVVETTKTLESVITFRQGKTSIDASQLPNVERIATYLYKHKDAKVIIKGYASPEGSIEVNERLAKERANTVKNMLINKYRINAQRIHSEGQGIGNMFSEADWNRVSICTIKEGE